MKLNCIIYNTELKNDISLYMKEYAAEMVKNGLSVPFKDMYRDMRAQGIEVDAESIGYIYSELFGDQNNDSFTPTSEIEEMVGASFKNSVDKSVDAFLREQPNKKTKETGDVKIEQTIAQSLSNFFNRKVLGDMTVTENTDLRQIQDMVKRAVTSLLPKDKTKKVTDLHGALLNFFSSDKYKQDRLDGGINNMRTIWDKVKEELDLHVAAATAKMSDEDAEIYREKWDNYFKSVHDASYNIMLGTGMQNELLNTALKQVTIDGVRVQDDNGNVNWDALIEGGHPDLIADNVARLFREGVSDKQGNIVKYDAYQAGVIGNYVKGIYEKKLAAVKQRKITNERISMQSSKNIISDFLKDAGFFNLRKDKSGNLLLTQSDWNSFKKYILKNGKEKGIDGAVKEFENFIRTKKDSEGNLLFDDEVKIAEAVKSFGDLLVAKFAPTTATPTAIQRAIALTNLNNGNAFQSQTSHALNKLAGVSSISQNRIDQIQQLVNAANQIYGNMVSSSVSPDGNINVGAFAYQALAQIDRKIKTILRENIVDENSIQNAVKLITDVLNVASSTLLLNPNNFSENPATGFMSNLSESVKQLFTSPELFFKQFGSNQKAFWVSFLSYALGGADTKIINEIDFEHDLPVGERKRLSELKDVIVGDSGLFKKLRKGASAAPLTLVSTAMRVLFSSFDAANNTAFMRKSAINTLYHTLVLEGKSKSEALSIIDKQVLKLSDMQLKELSDRNNDIMDAIRSAGLTPTKFDVMQNLNDMKFAFYQNAIISGASKVPTKTQAAELAQSFVKTGQDVAKKIGGKQKWHESLISFDIPLMLVYSFAEGATGVQRKAYKSQNEYEKRGQLTKAAFAQLTGSIFQNTMGRFVGGVANFMALSITATPLGFITALQSNANKNRFLQDAGGKIGFDTDPELVRKYARTHEMVRSAVTRATLGTMAMAGAIVAYYSDDDDDEGYLYNLMQTKSGRKMIARFVPMATAIVVNAMNNVEDDERGALDTKFKRFIDYAYAVTGNKYDVLSQFKEQIQRIPKDEDYNVALARLASGLFSVNTNQDEQITKFFHTLSSAFSSDYIDIVKNDDAITSEIYKNAQTASDAFFINGMFDKILRAQKGEINRYAESEK